MWVWIVFYLIYNSHNLTYFNWQPGNQIAHPQGQFGSHPSQRKMKKKGIASSLAARPPPPFHRALSSSSPPPLSPLLLPSSFIPFPLPRAFLLLSSHPWLHRQKVYFFSLCFHKLFFLVTYFDFYIYLYLKSKKKIFLCRYSYPPCINLFAITMYML